MMVVAVMVAVVIAPVVMAMPVIAIAVARITIPVRVTPVAIFVTIAPVVVTTMIAGLRLGRQNREAEEGGAEDGDGFEVHNVVPSPTRATAENSYECVVFMNLHRPGVLLASCGHGIPKASTGFPTFLPPQTRRYPCIV